MFIRFPFSCPFDAHHLKTDLQRAITPVNSTHRVHAALLDASLKLPLIIQVLASQQVESKLLDTLNQ